MTTERALRLLSLWASAIVVAILTVDATAGAFSASASAGGSAFAAGTVTITDDAAGTAIFTLSGMEPGDVETRCLVVTYQGTADATVRFYGQTTAGSGLGAYLDLDVERAAGDRTDDCAGFAPDATLWGHTAWTQTLAGLTGSHSTWATGLDQRTLDGGEPHEQTTYRFRVELLDNANAAGRDVVTRFVWEARSG